MSLSEFLLWEYVVVSIYMGWVAWDPIRFVCLRPDLGVTRKILFVIVLLAWPVTFWMLPLLAKEPPSE